MASSNLRISGLVSGLDIESMVKQLMAAARKPVDKLYQQKTLLEWKKEDYRTINNQLRTLRELVSKMRLQSTYLSRKVIVGDSSVVTAVSSNNAAATSYTIMVKELAQAARNESIAGISKSIDEKVDPNQTIWEQREELGLDSESLKQIWKYNTVTDEIVVEDTSKEQRLAHDAITKIISKDQDGSDAIIVKDAEGVEHYYKVVTNKDELGDGKVYLNVDTGELTFNTDIVKGSTIIAEYEYNTKIFDISFTMYNESGEAETKTFRVEAGNMTLNSLFSRMSSDRSLGISIFYDEYTDKVSISTTRTGKYNPLPQEAELSDEILFGSFDQDGNFIVDKFFTEVLKLKNGTEGKETGGTNAKVVINGLETERKSNEFTINGTTFTLQGKTEVETTVNVIHDGEAVFEAIKSFIEKYNEIIDKINSKLMEQRYRDYAPLTSEQKKEMKEDEIKLWEEKARSGLLRNDPILRNVLDKMRFAWSTPVISVGNTKLDQMTEYGIETGFYFEGGKLYIKNEAKLRQAINENPDEVLKFFTNNSSIYEEQGVAQRLYNALTEAMTSLTNQAGSDLSYSKYDQSILAERIRDIEKRISVKEKQLQLLEERYWKQFTALEQAIQAANAQSLWLTQQFFSS